MLAIILFLILAYWLIIEVIGGAAVAIGLIIGAGILAIWLATLILNALVDSEKVARVASFLNENPLYIIVPCGLIAIAAFASM